MFKIPNHKAQFIGIFCLLWLLAAIDLHSQTVSLKLRNGDRISGKIISENTNQLVITTKWAKELSIPLAEIQARELLPETVAAATNAPPVVKTNPPPAKVVVVTEQPKPAPKPKPPSSWHGDVQIGTDAAFSETQRQLYYGRFKTTYAPVPDPTTPGKNRLVERFRNIFDFNAVYGKTDGILSANHMEGSSKTDFDLGKDRRIFAYNLVGAGYDEIRKIDIRYEFGPGMGYHVITQSNFVFNTELGMNYQVQYLHDAENTERFFYRLAEDFTWKLSKKFSLDEKFEFFPQVNLEDYRFRFESNLRYWFLENLSFNLTLVDIFDTQPAPGIGRNDLQIRSSLGLKF